MSPRNGAPTRSAIVAAASALLESGGPAAVTLRSVGDAAGVSRSAAYRHFDDKADLLTALAEVTLLDLGESIRRGAGEGGGGTRLFRGCRGYLRYALEKPHHYLLILGDVPLAKPNRELEAAADDGLQELTKLVENAQADGEMVAGPARELATVLWALLHGLAQLDLTGHLSEPRTVAGRAGIEGLIALTLESLRLGAALTSTADSAAPDPDRTLVPSMPPAAEAIATVAMRGPNPDRQQSPEQAADRRSWVNRRAGE